MFSTDDTVVAIATPPGRGGIGVVRVSGPAAYRVAESVLVLDQPLAPRHATFCCLRVGADPGRHIADHVVATFFPGPRSYTGQDVVELSAHGSPVVLQHILSRAVAAGARLARPGEFTLRAFVGGKLDLVQAEAVGDLIAATTPLQAQLAFEQLDGALTARITALHDELFRLIAKLEASLDFPDEGYHFAAQDEIDEVVTGLLTRIDALVSQGHRGRTVREGATVVFAGKPNVGKSSLFNVLLGHERAIVSATPGTTRDLVTEAMEIEGVPVMLVDTAGFRDASDAVEREGVMRGQRSREVAALTLVVLDGSQPLDDTDLRLLSETMARARVVVANKCDQPRHGVYDVAEYVSVSAVTGEGIGALRDVIARELGVVAPSDTPAVSNVRHVALLERARQELETVRQLVTRDMPPEEFVLTHLHAAQGCFEEVVGTRTTDDVLAHIFSTFCIGK